MATLEQIQNRLKKLQAQADALIAKKAQAVVDQIRELMLKHGLTTADIETGATASRAAKTAAFRKSGINANAAKPAGVPKYLDPKTGATWTGRGRAPSWIAGAKDRTKFLAHGEVEAVSATAKKSAGAAKGVVRTGQPKGAQPAMYIDRKTGATWSGRGRAPAWLAKAKDRSKFLINPAVGTAATGSKEEVTPEAIRKNAVAARRSRGKNSLQ
jgi:DNA-binding protein H-NS